MNLENYFYDADWYDEIRRFYEQQMPRLSSKQKELDRYVEYLQTTPLCDI